MGFGDSVAGTLYLTANTVDKLSKS